MGVAADGAQRAHRGEHHHRRRRVRTVVFEHLTARVVPAKAGNALNFDHSSLQLAVPSSSSSKQAAARSNIESVYLAADAQLQIRLGHVWTPRRRRRW